MAQVPATNSCVRHVETPAVLDELAAESQREKSEIVQTVLKISLHLRWHRGWLLSTLHGVQLVTSLMEPPYDSLRSLCPDASQPSDVAPTHLNPSKVMEAPIPQHHHLSSLSWRIAVLKSSQHQRFDHLSSGLSIIGQESFQKSARTSSNLWQVSNVWIHPV